MDKKIITILLPSYNEEAQLELTMEEIPKHIPKEYDYRLLFVNDGSKDRSWEILDKASREDHRIQAINFSRNFGKEAAIVAGINEAEGDAVIVMDCDLQHPPRYIPKMLKLWEEGYEVVEGVKEKRQKETGGMRNAANLFYGLFKKLTDVDMKNSSDFKLLDRKVVDTLKSMPESSNFFRAQAEWVGFKRKSFVFEVDDRMTGETKWPINNLVRLAVNGITSFSGKPLYMIFAIGLIFLLASLIFGITAIFKLIFGNPITGTSGLCLLTLFITGIIVSCMGVVGVYLEKVLIEVKARPRYIISDSKNFRR